MKIAHKGYIYESDEEFDVEHIERDNNHDYKYVNNILYQITRGTEVEELPIDVIEYTTENSFYPAHVERYVKYIKEGGILTPFPVSISMIANTLEGMLEALDSDKNIEDDGYSEFKETGIPGLSYFSLSNILIDNDEGEKFESFNRLNGAARNISQCYPADLTDAEKSSLPFLEKVFAFFREHSEYTLLNQNHRLAALKEIGVTKVLVQIVS